MRRAPDVLRWREFKAKGKVMVTTMHCCKRYSKHDLTTFIEVDGMLNWTSATLKARMGMDVVSGNTIMALKEIRIYLLAYNLLRVIIAQSATQYDLLPRQLSFKHRL